MAIVFSNNARTTLASNISNSATTITVADGSVFPSLTGGDIFYCTIDDGTNNEIVEVTAISSNTLTVVRGQDNTTARAFVSGDLIELRLVAKVLETFPQVDAGEVTADEFIGDLRGAVIFKAQAGEAVAKGDAVYVSGISGTTPVVALADADFASKMPAFGLVLTAASTNGSTEVVTFGTISGVDTSAFSVGDTLYVSTTAGELTNSKPTGEASLLQNIGKVQRSHASAGSIKVGGAGRTNDTPNLNDGNIFIGNASNQATTASLNTKIEDYLDANGTTFPDNVKAQFGASNDLQIYHDGSTSYILDDGFGDLQLRSNNRIVIAKSPFEYMADFNVDGAVDLYYDNSKKLATTSQGISVTNLVQAEKIQLNASGTDNPQIQLNNNDFATFDWLINQADSGKYVVTVSGTSGAEMELESDGSDYTNAILHVGGQRVLTQTAGINLNGDLGFNDGYKAQFGASNDLQIYHDGSTNNSIIKETGSGNLELWGNNVKIMNVAGDETQLDANPNSGVTLYYDNAEKLATTSTGIDVTGTVTSSGNLTVNSNLVKISNTSGQSDLRFEAANDNFSQILFGDTDGTSRGTIRYKHDTDSFFIAANGITNSDLEITNSAVNVTGGNLQIGGTTIVNSSRNLTNIGTISSGAITSSGDMLLNSGNAFTDLNIKSDRASGNIGGVNFVNASDAIKGQIYGHTDGTVRIASGGNTVALTLDSSQNATFAGTISSGAITSSGTITGTGFVASSTSGTALTTNNSVYLRAIAPAVESGHTTKHELSMGWSTAYDRTYQAPKIDGTFDFADEFGYNFAEGNWYFEDKLKVGNLNIGSTNVIDSSRNLTNIGTISSGDITSSGNLFTSGYVTIDSTTDGKLKLKTPSGESSDWNYIEFYGADDTRDGYVGTDADGDMKFFSDKNSSELRLESSGATISTNLTVTGDLTVNGTTTTVNQTNLDVSDNLIGLNRGASSNANDSGMLIERGSTGDNVFIGWDESTDKITFATTTNVPSDTGNLTLTAAPIQASSLQLGSDTQPTLSGDGNLLRIQTSSGYLDIGSNNSGFAHIQTDRAKYYFNKRILVDEGIISSYDEDLVLQRAQSTVATFTTTGATFAGTISSGAITSSGNLVLDASGHNYIELHSSTANTRKWRFYNGQAWNPDALLIYDQDADSTALTIETNKLGIARGANSLSHTLDVGGNVAISGTEIITSARNLTNIGTISSGAITSTGKVSAFGNSDTVAGLEIYSDANHGLRILHRATEGDFSFERRVGGSNTEFLRIGRANGNATFAGTISSGAITSSGAISATQVGVTNIVTNKVVKFNGSILDDSNITDTGSLITLGSNTNIDGRVTLTSGTTTTIAGTGYLNINANVGGVNTNGSHGLHIGWNKSNGGREINMIFDGGTGVSDTEMIFTSTDGSNYYDIFQINGAGNVDIKNGGLRIGTTTVIDSSRNLTNIGTISSGSIDSSGNIDANGKFIVQGSGTLLELNNSGWNAGNQTHDILYNGWTASTGDYIYLSAAGNSNTGCGTILVTDSQGFYYGTHSSQGGVTSSATDPLSDVKFRVDGSGNITEAGTISASGSASSTSPTLSLTTSDSHTFNHLSNSFAGNMTSGESAIHIIGRAGSTKNSGYFGYKYSSAGSNDNVVTIGHWGSDHLVTINGVGNTTFAGTINSGAITSSGQVSGTTLKAENGSYDGFFGNASFSWGGSTLYPTIYSSHSDRWVMFTYPHIAYLQNGTNGHTGSTTGSTIRFASDASASNNWDIGIGSTTDLFRIARAGTNAIEINSSGDFTFRHSGHNYVRLESTGSFEQMIRFKNGLANYWYTGIRTSAGIASTADYHIYSTALGNDAAAVDTSGNIIAYNGFKVNTTQVVDSSTNIYSTGIINTNRIKDNGSSNGLRLGNFSTSNVDETGSSVVTFLRDGTFDDYIIKGSTARGVFGRQFIGPHFNSSHSWGVFSSGWDTHFQISGDDRIYMKPNVAIGATPSTTGPVLDVYQTADRPSMTIRSSNPGSWGASLIVGATTANQTTVDTNDRVMVILDGKYPVLNLNHTVNSNTNHGPTIQFTHDGYDSKRQWVIGSDGRGDRLDFGVSGGTAGTNTDGNPHRGISGYEGVTIMRLFEDGVLVGDTGVYPNEVTAPDGKLEVRGQFSHSAGNFLKKTYNKAIGLYANGTASSGSAIGFQQITGEGWTGIFVDYNPYEGWGLYHDNPSNYFYITAEATTGNLGTSFTVPNRDSGTSTAYAKHRFDQNNGNFDAGGAITAQGNITAYSSDKRLKENFKPIESALDKVKQLNGLYFDWNKVSEDAGFIPDQKQNDVGLIAQDVQQILPQAVAPAPFDTDVITTPKDPKDKNAGVTQEKISISGEDYLTVKYEKLVPLLVEAIKEQQEQIESLKSEINNLKGGK